MARGKSSIGPGYAGGGIDVQYKEAITMLFIDHENTAEGTDNLQWIVRQNQN